MRPIFTIHAGEFLFGEEIYKHRPNSELWIPVKDKGIDFLVTSPEHEKPVSVQVKMSRNYKPEVAKDTYEEQLEAGGWLTLNHDKLANSKADIWSILLVTAGNRATPKFINIPPKNLLSYLTSTFGKRGSYQSYPTVMKTKAGFEICFEARGLKTIEKQSLVENPETLEANRDLTNFYDDWSTF